jgi:hypothetical protein
LICVNAATVLALIVADGAVFSRQGLRFSKNAATASIVGSVVGDGGAGHGKDQAPMQPEPASVSRRLIVVDETVFHDYWEIRIHVDATAIGIGTNAICENQIISRPQRAGVN